MCIRFEFKYILGFFFQHKYDVFLTNILVILVNVCESSVEKCFKCQNCADKNYKEIETNCISEMSIIGNHPENTKFTCQVSN